MKSKDTSINKDEKKKHKNHLSSIYRAHAYSCLKNEKIGNALEQKMPRYFNVLRCLVRVRTEFLTFLYPEMAVSSYRSY